MKLRLSKSAPDLNMLLLQASMADSSVHSNTSTTVRSAMKRSDSVGDFSVTSNVSFGPLEIQEYPLVLGDNPSTSTGPSVELDWTAQSKIVIEDLDEWEAQKPPKREMNELAMPSQIRTKLLIESGHSMREIRETTSNRDSLRRKKSSLLGRFAK